MLYILGDLIWLDFKIILFAPLLLLFSRMAGIDMMVYKWNDEEYDEFENDREGDTDGDEEVITEQELDEDVQSLRAQALASRKEKQEGELRLQQLEGKRNGKGGVLATVDPSRGGVIAKSGWRRRRRRNQPKRSPQQDLRIGLVQSFWRRQQQLCGWQADIAACVASGRYLKAAQKQPKYTNYYNSKH